MLVLHQDSIVCEVLALLLELVELSDVHQERVDIDQLLALNAFRPGLLLRLKNLPPSPLIHLLFPHIEVLHKIIRCLNVDGLLISTVREASLCVFLAGIIGCFVGNLIERMLLEEKRLLTWLFYLGLHGLTEVLFATRALEFQCVLDLGWFIHATRGFLILSRFLILSSRSVFIEWLEGNRKRLLMPGLLLLCHGPLLVFRTRIQVALMLRGSHSEQLLVILIIKVLANTVRVIDTLGDAFQAQEVF